MSATIAQLSERFEVSDRQIRNYLKLVSAAHPDQALKAPGSRTELTDFAVSEIEKIREMGPAAYERSMLPVTVLEPIAQPAPEPQPEPIAQPAAPAFSDVATMPAAPIVRFEVIDGGLTPAPQSAPQPRPAAPIVQMGAVGGQILATTQSAQSGVLALQDMIEMMKGRLVQGIDHLHAQDRQSAAVVEEMETGLIELQTLAYEHDRLARAQSIRQQLRSDRLGKLTAEMQETAALSGFRLSQSC